MKQKLLAAAVCLFINGPALAMTETECAAMGKQADANADGTMNEAIFTENCMANLFETAKAN